MSDYAGRLIAEASIEAAKIQAAATVYAAAYAANLAITSTGANSKAGEAVHYFMQAIKNG